jgi:hypothetical protein
MNTSKKYIDLCLVILIFIILVSPLLFWFSLNGNWEAVSEIEGRKLSVFPKDPFRSQKTAVKRVFQGLLIDALDLFFINTGDNTLRDQLNTAVADQFPLRIGLTEIARTLERGLIASAYSVVSDPIFPASTDSTYFVTRDKTRLLKPPISFSQEIKHEIDLRIENYSELLKANPNINLYVLNIETLEYSKFNPLAEYYGDSDSGRSLNYFLKNKPKNLQFRNFEISSYPEYEANFFRTDHHWNIRGALQAYRQAYEMLSSNYPEISPMVDISKVGTVNDLKFLGSYARGSLYPVIPEPFEYADVSLPEYKTYVNGELNTYGGKGKYLSGNFSRDKYYNHYSGFYGSWKKSIVYEFQNSSNRNLLIVASSHARMNQMLIASHYKKTYVIDLRDRELTTIALNHMVSEFQIDDVLIMGQPDLTYRSSDYVITP